MLYACLLATLLPTQLHKLTSLPALVHAQVNTARVTAVYNGVTVGDTDKAHYLGIRPRIYLRLLVKAANGTWMVRVWVICYFAAAIQVLTVYAMVP
jgi:hypothetical protein